MLLALLGPLGVGPASAKPQPQSQPESGDAFSHGLALFDAKDYAGAAEVWERLLASMGEAKGWKVLYNLGLAYENVLDATRAVERYDAFVRAVEREPPPLPAALEDRRADAADRSRALKATHGALRVHAPASGEAVLVRIGDAPARAAPFTAYLRPGHVVVEIGASGPRPRRVEVDVAAGISADVDATEAPIGPPPQGPISAAVPPIPPQTSPRPAFPTVWVLAGAGLTAASVALPIALNARAQSKRDAAEKLGVGHTQYAQTRDEFDSARTLYYVSYSVPALLGALTIGIAVVGAVRSGGEPSPATSIGVHAERGGASICMHSTF